jgi:hypothetical protein
MMPTRYPSATPTRGAPRSETDPQNFRSGSNVPQRGEASFLDAAHWNELTAKYLGRFNLPAWAVPCTPLEMDRWLYRLNLPVKRWLATGTYADLADFITMNPAWPLRAFIGLACELADEVRQ